MSTTILLVDDSESLRRTMRAMLEESDFDVRVIEASNGVEALPIALGGDVDIVLSDVVMPQMDGIGLLRGIRQHKDATRLPVILVTSGIGTDTRDLSFEIGASDYLTRPFSEVELLTRISVQMRLQALQAELDETASCQQKVASSDFLTGLPNRSSFISACTKELSRSQRYELLMTVGVLDVDNLRRVNADLGLQGGDSLLREIAALMIEQLRTSDTLARFEGGRFGILLPHTDPTQAVIALDRVRELVASRALGGEGGGRVTLSVGAAGYPAPGIESIDDLLNAAQASLDQAKARGGDCLSIAPESEAV